VGNPPESKPREIARTLSSIWARLKGHQLARIGSGLITGAAGDDPSGIATYSQARAQYGLDMLWTMLAAFPWMSAIQSICGRIGRGFQAVRDGRLYRKPAIHRSFLGRRGGNGRGQLLILLLREG
jgi:hypothetical protein